MSKPRMTIEEARREIRAIPELIESIRGSSAEGGDESLDDLWAIRDRVIELSRAHPGIFATVKRVWGSTALRFTHPCPPDFREGES